MFISQKNLFIIIILLCSLLCILNFNENFTTTPKPTTPKPTTPKPTTPKPTTPKPTTTPPPKPPTPPPKPPTTTPPPILPICNMLNKQWKNPAYILDVNKYIDSVQYHLKNDINLNNPTIDCLTNLINMANNRTQDLLQPNRIRR